MQYDLTEGQGVEIGGVPVALVRARGRRAVLLIASTCGDELDGPMPLETLDELKIRARRLMERLDLADEPPQD